MSRHARLSAWLRSSFVHFLCHSIAPQLHIKSDLSAALDWGKVITYFAFFRVIHHCIWQVDKCIWKIELHVRLGREKYLWVGQDPLEDLPDMPEHKYIFQAGYLTPSGSRENSMIAGNLPLLWTVERDFSSPSHAAAARPWASTGRLLWFMMLQRVGKLGRKKRHISGFIQWLEMNLNMPLCKPRTGTETVCCTKYKHHSKGVWYLSKCSHKHQGFPGDNNNLTQTALLEHPYRNFRDLF